MNTSVKQKKEFWPKFEAACHSQWMCGGDRYALSPDKEFTDLICEAVENKFCASQILKQTGELINVNPKPEVSFFKIAVWAFIWWLKEQENLTDRDKGEEFDAGTQPEVPFINPENPAARVVQQVRDALRGTELSPEQKDLLVLEIGQRVREEGAK